MFSAPDLQLGASRMRITRRLRGGDRDRNSPGQQI
jgi:hypothetical protein